MKAKLSMAFSDLRGKAGNLVVQKSKAGLVVKERTIPRNPRTAKQTAVRNALMRASRAFRNLTPMQLAAWRAYADSLIATNPIEGDKYPPSAINVFTALVTKLLQVNPEATIPLDPPSTPFVGEKWTVTAENTAGGILYSANGINDDDIATELLIQPLASPNRVPQPDRYATGAFTTFEGGAETYLLSVPAGYYTAGYRFVNTATGQATLPVYLGDIITVTASSVAAKKKSA